MLPLQSAVIHPSYHGQCHLTNLTMMLPCLKIIGFLLPRSKVPTHCFSPNFPLAQPLQPWHLACLPHHSSNAPYVSYLSFLIQSFSLLRWASPPSPPLWNHSCIQALFKDHHFYGDFPASSGPNHWLPSLCSQGTLVINNNRWKSLSTYYRPGIEFNPPLMSQ